MTTIEPRVAERRRGVSEDRARHRLRRILLVIGLVALGAVGFWLIRSPLLSVSTISVTGADRSDPAATIADLGIVVGMPTIDVDLHAIERAVEADPWVENAEVSVRWPGTVTVAVSEHVPLAAARSGSGWVMLSRAGTVIEQIDRPPETGFIVDIDTEATDIGGAIDDAMITGALAFGSALREDLASDAVITTDGEGLAATVGGHVVKLGRPIELEDKALVLASLLDTGLAEGAEINLIAPTRPAVSDPDYQPVDPEAEVEVEE